MASQTINLSEFANVLGVMGVLDTEPLLRVLGQVLIGATKRNFVEERDPDGNPWKPLKRPRRNTKGRDRILQDHGTLRTSVTAKGARDNVEILTPTSLTWGTSVAYGKYHQYGTSDKPRVAKGGWTQETSSNGKVKAVKDGEKPKYGEEAERALGIGVRAGIPARPFLGIGDELADQLTEVAADWVERAIGGR